VQRIRIAITGKPGCGKTTLCERIYQRIEGIDCGGFITKEVRERGVRVGFKIVDLEKGDEKWLAHVRNPSKIRVGKYGVYLDGIDEIADRIASYTRKDLIIIDELGPMELKSKKFVNSIYELIDGDLNLIFTIHLKSKHPLLNKIRREFEVIEINKENREQMVEKILEKMS
jgi:nucleoside-triphosphatase